jgi:hypothetical protein
MALPGETVKLQGKQYRTILEYTKPERRGQYLASEPSMRIEMRQRLVLLRVNLIRLIVQRHLSLQLFLAREQPLVYRGILKLRKVERVFISQTM